MQRIQRQELVYLNKKYGMLLHEHYVITPALSDSFAVTEILIIPFKNPEACCSKCL